MKNIDLGDGNFITEFGEVFMGDHRLPLGIIYKPEIWDKEALNA